MSQQVVISYIRPHFNTKFLMITQSPLHIMTRLLMTEAEGIVSLGISKRDQSHYHVSHSMITLRTLFLVYTVCLF